MTALNQYFFKRTRNNYKDIEKRLNALLDATKDKYYICFYDRDNPNFRYFKEQEEIANLRLKINKLEHDLDTIIDDSHVQKKDDYKKFRGNTGDFKEKLYKLERQMVGDLADIIKAI